MDSAVFREFCAIAHREAGIVLSEGKEALVSARVTKRLRALGLTCEKEYLKQLKDQGSNEEMRCFLDAISTNFTSFKREPEHFDILARMAHPDRIDARRPFRIWCAAAATGEEPYTIVITMLDALDGRKLDFKLLATDISVNALNAAIAGCYEEKTVAPLSRAQRAKYLQKRKSKADGVTYEVRPEFKEWITFRRLNLSTPPFPMKGLLDVVFCRNVMIYFAREVRQGLVSEIERLLRPGGILFTGHSETLGGLRTGLKMVQPSVYTKQ